MFGYLLKQDGDKRTLLVKRKAGTVVAVKHVPEHILPDFHVREALVVSEGIILHFAYTECHELEKLLEKL